MSTLLPQRDSLRANVLFGYGLQIANYLIPLITLPYLIRVLGLEAYGQIAYAYAAMMFAVIFLDAGIDTLAMRKLSTTDDAKSISLHFAAVTWLKVSICLVLAMALWIATAWLDTTLATLLWGNTLLLLGTVTFPVWLFRGLEKMRYATLSGIGGRLLCASAMLLLVNQPDDLLIAALLQAAATLCSGLLVMPIIWRHLPVSLRHPPSALWREIKAIGYACRTLSAAEFLEKSTANSAIFVLGLFAPAPVVGAFAAIEKLARAGFNLFQPFLRALLPLFSRTWHSDTTKAEKLWRQVNLALVATMSMAFALWLLAGEALLHVVFGTELHAAATLVPLFILWALFALLNVGLGLLGLIAAGHTQAYATTLLITTCIQAMGILCGALATSQSLVAVGVAAGLAATEAIRTVYLAQAWYRCHWHAAIDKAAS